MQHSMIDSNRERLQQCVAAARARGADAAKISLAHQETTDCRFESNSLKSARSAESLSYMIEVLVGGRIGRTTGNRLEALDQLLDGAVTLAREGKHAHFAAYPGPAPVHPVRMHSPATLELSRQQMIASCEGIIRALLDFNGDLSTDAGGGISESEGLLVTSGGVCHATRTTMWGMGAYTQRTEGTDILFAGHNRAWGEPSELYAPDAFTEHILWLLRHAATQDEPPAGEVYAVLPPEMLARLLWAIFLGTNGRNVAKGDSPLAGRIGEQVLAPSMTIVDDPHIDFANGATEMDGDGVPARRQTMFENGVLRRFLYDLDSAGLAGVEPTGNNGCQPYSPQVVPGAEPVADLISRIEDGIYVQDVIGFGQSNIINGDFSANVCLGYRIRNGEITGRVKDTMIAGNIYSLLAQGVELSSDTNYDGRFPYAVVSGLSVSSQAAR